MEKKCWWAYEVHLFDGMDKNLEDWLYHKGQEGWELCGIYGNKFIFKKSI